MDTMAAMTLETQNDTTIPQCKRRQLKDEFIKNVRVEDIVMFREEFMLLQTGSILNGIINGHL